MGHNCVRYAHEDNFMEAPVRKKRSRRDMLARESYDYTIPSTSATDAFMHLIRLSEERRQKVDLLLAKGTPRKKIMTKASSAKTVDAALKELKCRVICVYFL
eukprot:TRINITY_DN4379_c0_g1_i3.p3 TRINITY_DN4379_c0_g1~~TRINITY_DN4379_c0_g1_i3.p3  ORF type:complete len:102 (-),score=30.75 TRINITY_DN4379_c0_g1_i3:144-449(-)